MLKNEEPKLSNKCTGVVVQYLPAFTYLNTVNIVAIFNFFGKGWVPRCKIKISEPILKLR